MFDGMPDQFFQLLAAASRANTTSLPLPLPFSLHHHHHHHGSYPSTYQPQQPQQQQQQTSFDNNPSNNYNHQQQQQGLLLSPPPHLLHHSQLPLHLQHQQQQHSQHVKHEDKEAPVMTVAPPVLEPIDPWSNDEVLTLLRVRSSMDNSWFPDFIWENVSRKLAELGFKRSAEKCKEKFEEETRSFNSSFITNTCSNKNVINNYRLFGELEELYNDHSDHHQTHQHQSSPLSSPPTNPDDHEFNDHRPEPSLSQRNQSPEQNEDEEVEEEDNNTGQQKRLKDDNEDDDTKSDKVRDEQSVDDSEKTEENTKRMMRKRKRQKKFEMFKGFCENIVNKMMAQQEQLHCKILQDMVKRDEEKIAMEEAWKKQEIERVHKEMEIRAHELAIAGDRQAKILEFLKKFASNSLEVHSLKDAIENLIKVPHTSSNSSVLTQDSLNTQPTSSCTTTHDKNPNCLVTKSCSNMPTSSPSENLAPRSPNRVENSKLALPLSSSANEQASQSPNPLNSGADNDALKLASVSTYKSTEPNHTSTDAAEHIMDFRSPENQATNKPSVGNIKDDTGRRWPRDEVLALINIRCSLFNSNGDPHHDKEGSAKGPLWEKISQKMMELGYKRSAKRCKEKWENINKYFRKTKDLNKKRSIDSRTCPYFHQLNHLYSQGTLVETADRPTNLPGSPENRSIALSDIQGGSSTSNGATNMHASQGNEGVVQAPSFDFEF